PRGGGRGRPGGPPGAFSWRPAERFATGTGRLQPRSGGERILPAVPGRAVAPAAGQRSALAAGWAQAPFRPAPRRVGGGVDGAARPGGGGEAGKRFSGSARP